MLKIMENIAQNAQGILKVAGSMPGGTAAICSITIVTVVALVVIYLVVRHF